MSPSSVLAYHVLLLGLKLIANARRTRADRMSSRQTAEREQTLESNWSGGRIRYQLCFGWRQSRMRREGNPEDFRAKEISRISGPVCGTEAHILTVFRLYCSFHFFAKDGMVILCVCLGTVQYWWISTGLVIVRLRAVFCPSVQYLSFFCEAFSWKILDSSSFPLFHSGQVLRELLFQFTVVLPQIFFSLTTLFSYLVFFWLFRALVRVAGTHKEIRQRNRRILWPGTECHWWDTKEGQSCCARRLECKSGVGCLWKLARHLWTLLQWWHKWERTQTSGVCHL